MNQPYHPLVQPRSDQSAQHQDVIGLKDNPLYNAWKILAQLHATLTATLYDAGYWPLDTRNAQLGEELHQLGSTLADIADRRDMAWAYYARDAQRHNEGGRLPATLGACRECTAIYCITKRDPTTLTGICGGCWLVVHRDEPLPITRGTCVDCGGSYLIVSTEKETLQGLCDGCYAESAEDGEAEEEPGSKQPDTKGEPYAETISDPFTREQ